MGTSTSAPGLPATTITEQVRRALAEDVGSGDVTTDLLIPAGARASAVLVARAPGVVCGLSLAREAFRELEPSLDVTLNASDGDPVAPGDPLLTVSGPARPILTAERVALNFVGRLSGIATLTRAYVRAVEGTGATILDTRKTTPGHRALDKFAVRCGGGENHRMGLHDGFMLKDNHRAALERAGASVPQAVAGARRDLAPEIRVTLEADTLEQVAEAVEAGADVVLLDNMDPATLAEAVEIVTGRARTEASGGITLETVRAAAESGVDYISVGALTHSAPALDVALEIDWNHEAD